MKKNNNFAGLMPFLCLVFACLNMYMLGKEPSWFYGLGLVIGIVAFPMVMYIVHTEEHQYINKK